VKRAFTLIELMIVIAIIAIIAAIAMSKFDKMKVGATVYVSATGQQVVIMREEAQGGQLIYSCRVDNGPEAKERFTEVRFFRSELVLELPAAKKPWSPDVERR